MTAQAEPDQIQGAAAIGRGRALIYAAGSLKSAIGAIRYEFSLSTGTKVEASFGASGLLRQRIEAGARPGLFLSADMHHPAMLARAGLADRVEPFLTNALCLILREGLTLGGRNIAAALLDPAVSIGMSTPGNDPSGDYALALFRAIEAERPGSFAVLDAKARRLTGAPGKPKAPGGRNLYGWLMEKRAVDIFVTYRTNAMLARRDVPGLSIVELPLSLAIKATYGLAVMSAAQGASLAFADHLAGPQAHAIFEDHGFAMADRERTL